MKDISFYIEQSLNMENTSDGGSEAYHFNDGVVLIKYCYPCAPTNSNYARKDEEQITEYVNKAIARGACTPEHLGIKREREEQELPFLGLIENDICWVLQERAKGINLAKIYDQGSNKSLQFISEIVDAPDVHYENLIRTICELYDCGLELKCKNVFYDKEFGFTIIDLLRAPTKSFNSNSIEDVETVLNYTLGAITSPIQYSLYESKNNDLEQNLDLIRLKVVEAAEKVIPNFTNIKNSLNENWRCCSKNSKKSVQALGLETITEQKETFLLDKIETEQIRQEDIIMKKNQENTQDK